MSDYEAPTLKQMQIPVALVVGGSDRLIGAISEAAVQAQVLVAECAVADALTMAAQMRPLVLVMSEEVYEFDRDSFDTLARDVRSRCLVVGEGDLDPVVLEQQLRELMFEAENQRPSWVGDV
jgi:hypothetical protein